MGLAAELAIQGIRRAWRLLSRPRYHPALPGLVSAPSWAVAYYRKEKGKIQAKCPHQGPRGFPSLPLAVLPRSPLLFPDGTFQRGIFLCSHWFFPVRQSTPHSLGTLAGQPGNSAEGESATVPWCRSRSSLLFPGCAILCSFTCHSKVPGQRIT